MEESVELLRELNEKAPIITTPIEQLSGEKLLETMEHSKSLEEELLLEEEICPECGHVHEHEHHHHCHEEHDHHEHHHHHGEECGCGHGHHHEHHHEHEHHHDGECGCGCGHDHDHHHHHHAEDGTYGTVLRAKGMVAGADGEWIYFDMVPQEHEVRSGAAEYTGRICVIGSRLEEDKLEELFGLKK